MTTPQPCPSAEALAAYLDGRLTPAERAEVEKHVAGCEDCFEQLAAAAAFQAEEAQRGVVTEHPSARRAPARWIAVAAAAGLVVVGVWLTRGRPGSLDGAPDVLARAERLGSTDQLKAAAARAWSDEGGGLAFGAGLPPAKRAFRLGVHLLDARVALEAREDALLLAALERVAALLPAEGMAPEIAKRLRSIQAGAAAGHNRREDLDQLASVTREIGPAAFDFGAWAETGRLASLGANTDLLASAFATSVDDVLKSTAAADPATAQELEAIRDALIDRQVSTAELPGLAHSFEQLLLLN